MHIQVHRMRVGRKSDDGIVEDHNNGVGDLARSYVLFFRIECIKTLNRLFIPVQVSKVKRKE